MENELLSYGKLLGRARTDAGVTQLELAQDIRVKRETVSRWERDLLKVTPSAQEMHRLCARLPELSELQLLLALGYDLSPAAELALSRDEQILVTAYRQLSPALRRVILRQVAATAPPPLGSSGE